jgi:hypothetical protein
MAVSACRSTFFIWWEWEPCMRIRTRDQIETVMQVQLPWRYAVQVKMQCMWIQTAGYDPRCGIAFETKRMGREMTLSLL